MAIINGTAGADALNGTAGEDEIRALAGNDTIMSSVGADKIDGGVGKDTVDYSASAKGINVDVRLGVGLTGRGGDAEGDVLTNIESIIGSKFNDTFTSGADARATPLRFEGGAGNDIYYINNGATPTIIEQAAGGNDEVRVSVINPSGTLLAANVENLTYVGDKAFKGYGNDSNNIITGGSGNDTLHGGGGADKFVGGAGIDTVGYLDSKVGVTINLKTGVHTGIATGDTYNGIETISGSNLADTFVGNGSGIDFDGGLGIDTVDYSKSTAGVNVEVRLGTGAVGTGGDAEGTTLTNIESVIGSAFNDTFTSGADARATPLRFEGGAGNDIYYINKGATPTIIEQAGGGNDEVRVSVINPSGTLLAANVENLTYVGDKAFKGYGNDSNNIITGGSGNDTLYGGGGADKFIGGAGIDTVGYLDSKAGVTVNLKTGVHTGIATGDTYNGIEAMNGSNLADTFVGNGSGIDFDGGLGIDTVDYSKSTAGVNVEVRLGTGAVGTGGDAEGTTLTNIESVIGSAFNDTFTSGADARATPLRFEGGAGNDIYYINKGATPIIIEQAGGGNDEMRVSVINPSSTVLAANVERLTYIGDKAFKGYGNDSNNIITGGSGNDTLFGGGGADKFIGGAGIDTVGYLDSKAGVTVNLKTGVHTGIAIGDTYNGIEVINGSNLADTFVGNGSGIDFDGGLGVDTVDYSKSTSRVNIDVRLGTGAVGIGGDAEGTTLTNIESVLGSAFNDTFTVGTDARNPGYRFEGGAGDDIYNIDSITTPTIIEQAGSGNDEIRVSLAPSSGIIMATNVERLTYTGDKAFKGYGNDSNNIITGGSGNDTLYGGGGTDKFIGGAGIDTIGYLDSKAGVTVNLKTGVHTGIATGDTYNGIETISGSNLADTFVGNGNGMDLDGGLGIDTVDYSTSKVAVNVDVRIGTGAAGIGGDAEGTTLTNIESVIGSALNDTFTVGQDARNPGYRLEGGTGNDIYNIDSITTPTIIEQANGGNDEIRVSLANPSGTLMAANIERLTFIGDQAFSGYGNDSNNIITGGAGNDTLYGGGGADQFIGGNGYDTAGYLDSTVAMIIDLKTGVHSGIAAGDTYTNIEMISGSNFNDIFYAAPSSMGLEGGSGKDLVTYAKSNSAVTIDLITAANTGDAAGDTYTGIEIFQGSRFNDTLSGSWLDDTFVGGTGADVIDGREGRDSAWYITSAAGVIIDLQTQINKGGDAEGDSLVSIERVTGSHFNDTLTGDAGTNYLEGALGNDIIKGGDGNDYLYGELASQIGPFTLPGPVNDPQADVLYGGNGSDTIVTAASDQGSQAYGEAGDDVITVASGMADGGEGNDLLTGTGLDFSLSGGSGNDRLVLKSSGRAEGGEGDDVYTINPATLVTIQDKGTSNGDILILSYINSHELISERVGNDLYLHHASFATGQTPREGALLKDWFAGYNTIEQVQTADLQIIGLPIDSGAVDMFG